MADATATEILIAGNGNMNGNGVFGTVTVTDTGDGLVFTGGETITIGGVDVASYDFLGVFTLGGVDYALVTIIDDGSDGSNNDVSLAIPEDGTSTIPNGSTGLDVDNPADVDPGGTIDANLCFLRGTLIATPKGEIAVENLMTGDLVTCWDGREAEILWIGSDRHHPFSARRHLHLRPIEIAAGALGPSMPETALCVSPDHAMYLHDPLAELTHDTADILAPAEALLDRPGVTRMEVTGPVEYFHILCARHEVLIANGAPAESLYPTEASLQMIGAENIEAIEKTLPGFSQNPAQAIGPEAAIRLSRSAYAALREVTAA